MTTITIANQKGGVGKSTTAIALLDGLRARGYKTLGIDLDPQGNLSGTAKADKGKATIANVMAKDGAIKDSIQESGTLGPLIPSAKSLAYIEKLMNDNNVPMMYREYILKEAMESLEGYDYIIIDTPPELGLLSMNALTASNYVIIPTIADKYSMMGIDQLYGTIKTIQKYTNKDLKILGILVTMYNKRATLTGMALSQLEQMAQSIGTRVFDAKIRSSIAVREAEYMDTPLLAYNSKSTASIDYEAFIDEILELTKNNI